MEMFSEPFTTRIDPDKAAKPPFLASTSQGVPDVLQPRYLRFANLCAIFIARKWAAKKLIAQ